MILKSLKFAIVGLVSAIISVKAGCRIGSQELDVNDTSHIRWTDILRLRTINSCITSCYLDRCSMLEWIPPIKGDVSGAGECRRVLNGQQCSEGVAVKYHRTQTRRIVLQCFQCLDKNSEFGRPTAVNDSPLLKEPTKSLDSELTNLAKKPDLGCHLTFQVAEMSQTSRTRWHDIRQLPTLRLCIMSCYLDQCDLLEWIPPPRNGSIGICRRRFGPAACEKNGLTLSDYAEGHHVALFCFACDNIALPVNRQTITLEQSQILSRSINPLLKTERDDECMMLSWHAQAVVPSSSLSQLLLITHNVSDAKRCAQLCYNMIGCDSVEYVPSSQNGLGPMCALYAPRKELQDNCDMEIRQISVEEEQATSLTCIKCEMNHDKMESMAKEIMTKEVHSEDKGCVLASFGISQALEIEHLADYSLAAEVPNPQVCAQLCLAQEGCEAAVIVPPLDTNQDENPGCYTLLKEKSKKYEEVCRNDSARFVNYIHLSTMRLHCVQCEYSTDKVIGEAVKGERAIESITAQPATAKTASTETPNEGEKTTAAVTDASETTTAVENNEEASTTTPVKFEGSVTRLIIDMNSTSLTVPATSGDFTDSTENALSNTSAVNVTTSAENISGKFNISSEVENDSESPNKPDTSEESDATTNTSIGSNPSENNSSKSPLISSELYENVSGEVDEDENSTLSGQPIDNSTSATNTSNTDTILDAMVDYLVDGAENDTSGETIETSENSDNSTTIEEQSGEAAVLKEDKFSTEGPKQTTPLQDIEGNSTAGTENATTPLTGEGIEVEETTTAEAEVDTDNSTLATNDTASDEVFIDELVTDTTQSPLDENLSTSASAFDESTSPATIDEEDGQSNTTTSEDTDINNSTSVIDETLTNSTEALPTTEEIPDFPETATELSDLSTEAALDEVSETTEVPLPDYFTDEPTDAEVVTQDAVIQPATSESTFVTGSVDSVPIKNSNESRPLDEDKLCTGHVSFEAAPAFIVFETVLRSSAVGAADCARACFDEDKCNVAIWQRIWGIFPKCLLLNTNDDICEQYPRLSDIRVVDDSTPIRLQCIRC